MVQLVTKYKEAFISGLFLAIALLAEYIFNAPVVIYLSLYVISYLVVGGPVWVKAFKSMRNGTIFSEFFLMGIATLGAFAIGEYAEGVAVMLFYMIGEYVQHGAVYRAKSSIKSLVDQQPDVAEVERNGSFVQIHPAEVEVGETIRVKPGQKVPLDGELITDSASFNTAALTGESKPMQINEGEEVWAGSINQKTSVRIKVISGYEDTKLAHILTMVQEAAERKAPTQRFISKFAAVYTPIVVWLAVAVTFVPYLFVQSYVFQDWFYRALVFLVISCPCGLVISIPLGYFGGIGAASRNGILLKGSDFLDQLRKMKILFLDKTGTLTKGSFEVQRVEAINGFSEEDLLQWAASLEAQSTHPIGRAIIDFNNGNGLKEVTGQEEISGRGLKGRIENKTVLVGNRKLLKEQNIQPQTNGVDKASTLVYIAVDGNHVGTIYIADTIKDDSHEAVERLRKQGLEKLIMLSGDNQAVTDAVANELKLDEAYGGLLPDEKYKYVERALNGDSTVGFVGDGVNDAPVITLADVGMAMGGMGSDATIETADVVIQTDQPSKIPTAIEIANFTHRIVWENIVIALGVKVGVMVLATVGYASMWAAIFADVGVALIAIANAVRVQQHFSGEGYFEMLTSSQPELQDEKPQTCCENC
ncbi:MAG: cadmium-translocating P-type ATPase [Balneolaceae bacterium]|nr:cadmium-translocating P-type ATPase [Balneolaceae bacterium]